MRCSARPGCGAAVWARARAWRAAGALALHACRHKVPACLQPPSLTGWAAGRAGAHVEAGEHVRRDRARVGRRGRHAQDGLVLRPRPQRLLADALERVDVLVVGVQVAGQLHDEQEADHVARLELAVVHACAAPPALSAGLRVDRRHAARGANCAARLGPAVAGSCAGAARPHARIQSRSLWNAALEGCVSVRMAPGRNRPAWPPDALADTEPEPAARATSVHVPAP